MRWGWRVRAKCLRTPRKGAFTTWAEECVKLVELFACDRIVAVQRADRCLHRRRFSSTGLGDEFPERVVTEENAWTRQGLHGRGFAFLPSHNKTNPAEAAHSDM